MKTLLLILTLFPNFFSPTIKEQVKQRIPIDVVIVERADISNAEQLAMLRLAASKWLEAGVEVRIERVHYWKSFEQNKYSQYMSRLDYASKLAKRQRIVRRNVILHFALPPVCNEEGCYGGGVAGAICTNQYRNRGRMYSYSILRLKNDYGADRYLGSLVSAAHELGHNLGCNHADKEQNLMRYYFNEGPQPILPISKRQVDYCRQGKNPTGVFSRPGIESRRVRVEEVDRPFR